jgi:alkanesulfonate monooxygenase SsuD/methylene tetrahydromethanopterin reductase-like flavin-dependent oxidoreductase (luciferase family)
MQFLFTHVGDDQEAAKRETAGFLGGNYNQDFSAFVDRVAAAGTAEQVAARVQQYVDAGARHIIFTPATRVDRMAMVRRIMSEVVPRVRSSSS